MEAATKARLMEMRRASVQLLEKQQKEGSKNIKPYDAAEARKRAAARRRKAPRRGYIRHVGIFINLSFLEYLRKIC